LGNCSVAETDLEEGETKTAYSDQDGRLQEGVNVSIFTLGVDRTRNKRSSSHYGKGSDLSSEGGSHDKELASETEAAGSDGLQLSMATSDKDKLGSIPEHSEEEEQSKEEHSQSQKGLGKHMSGCILFLFPKDNVSLFCFDVHLQGLRFLFVGTCYDQEWVENLLRKSFNSILSARRISSHLDQQL
jgi:phosphatidate phosphatase LPIN